MLCVLLWSFTPSYLITVPFVQVEGAFYSYASPTPTNTDPYTVAYSQGKPDGEFPELANEDVLHDLDLILRLLDIVVCQLHLDHLFAYNEDLWQVPERCPVYAVLTVCRPPLKSICGVREEGVS